MTESTVRILAENVTTLKWLFGTVATIVTAIIGTFFVWLKSVARRQADHEVKVAETYISKDDFKEAKEDILRAIDSVKDLINKG